MCETAVICEYLNSVSWWTSILDLSLPPVVLSACSGLQLCSKFLHHRWIVARVITGDVANLRGRG